jgi:hypothetical protein
MVCVFCGLETGNLAGHETQEACLAALQQEIVTLRKVLSMARPPGDTPEPESPGAETEVERT